MGHCHCFPPSFLCQPVFALYLWWFLERVSCFSQLQETSAWCISAGSKAQDGVLPFPTGIKGFAYLLILVTIGVCQCPGRERVCCPFSSGLRSLLHRRKGSGESGGALCLFTAMADNFLHSCSIEWDSFWSFAMNPVFLISTLWRLVEKRLCKWVQTPVVSRDPSYETCMLAHT